jgi:hypothetical protein
MRYAAKGGTCAAAQRVWTLAPTLHIRRYAQLGKSSVGEQYGQENLEEIEEDQPDEAVDENVQVGASFWVTEALGRNGVRARFGRAEMIKGCRREAGGPFIRRIAFRILPTCLAIRASE